MSSEGNRWKIKKTASRCFSLRQERTAVLPVKQILKTNNWHSGRSFLIHDRTFRGNTSRARLSPKRRHQRHLLELIRFRPVVVLPPQACSLVDKHSNFFFFAVQCRACLPYCHRLTRQFHSSYLSPFISPFLPLVFGRSSDHPHTRQDHPNN